MEEAPALMVAIKVGVAVARLLLVAFAKMPSVRLPVRATGLKLFQTSQRQCCSSGPQDLHSSREAKHRCLQPRYLLAVYRILKERHASFGIIEGNSKMSSIDFAVRRHVGLRWHRLHHQLVSWSAVGPRRTASGAIKLPPI